MMGVLSGAAFYGANQPKAEPLRFTIFSLTHTAAFSLHKRSAGSDFP
jgi:hypothetical protein